MHHSGGAYAETQLIYGAPIRQVLNHGGRSFLSVGLGCGYNEMLVATECLKKELPPEQIFLLSFESEESLRQSFLDWLRGDNNSLYESIAVFFQEDSGISTQALRAWLLRASQVSTWVIESTLTRASKIPRPVECILYDAFSSKTCPDLWQEDFLMEFLAQTSAPNCCLSTYACTGALCRGLKTTGFRLVLRPGFHGKRNSTLALKGAFQAIPDFLNL